VRELWILRHAHAEPYVDEATDFDRALDPRGRSEAEALGRLAARLALAFDYVIVSPARRTRSTAAGIIGALSIPAARVEEHAGIYLAERRMLADLVRALPATAGRALLVGHNPGVSRLAQWALDDADLEEFRPATRIGMRADIDQWTDAGPGLFERVRTLRPEDLQTSSPPGR
jgi:phosphohistidine phosphatase